MLRNAGGIVLERLNNSSKVFLSVYNANSYCDNSENIRTTIGQDLEGQDESQRAARGKRERDLCMTGNITTTCSFCPTNIISRGHKRGLVLSTVGHYWSRIWWLLVAIVVPSVSAHKETKVKHSDVSQDRITSTGWLTSRLDEDYCLTNLL